MRHIHGGDSVLKKMIEHVQGVRFQVTYPIKIGGIEETLTFTCYSPDGRRHKWVLRHTDTDSLMETDYDFGLRQFALAVCEIDTLPVCKYIKDELGMALPELLNNVSDNPHEWHWSHKDSENQVAAIANLVYDVLGKLPHDIQDELTKIFRTEYSLALGLEHVALELDRVDDYLALLQRQAEELGKTQSAPTSELQDVEAPSQSQTPSQTQPEKEKQQPPPGMKLNEGAHHQSAFFTPPHEATQEYHQAVKQQELDEKKKERTPEVEAAMAHTMAAFKH